MAMTNDEHELEQHARELFPQDVYLQQQWLRGVRIVRTTARGWLLDLPPLHAIAPSNSREDDSQ
jgi:hypothetical protein